MDEVEIEVTASPSDWQAIFRSNPEILKGLETYGAQLARLKSTSSVPYVSKVKVLNFTAIASIEPAPNYKKKR